MNEFITKILNKNSFISNQIQKLLDKPSCFQVLVEDCPDQVICQYILYLEVYWKKQALARFAFQLPVSWFSSWVTKGGLISNIHCPIIMTRGTKLFGIISQNLFIAQNIAIWDVMGSNLHYILSFRHEYDFKA